MSASRIRITFQQPFQLIQFLLAFFFFNCLRAPDQKYRESHDRSEISYFILFHQKYLSGKLFSKIIIKSSSAFWFFQKLQKFKIRLEACLRPPETRENRASLASSYATMEIVPVLPFGS